MKSKLLIPFFSFLCGVATVMLLHRQAANAPPPVAAHGVLPPALDRRLARVEFRAMPLQTALETLSRDAGCAIAVRWPELVLTGVNEYTPVDADLRDVPLSAALKEILSAAAGNFANLDFRAEGETVLVSTTSDLLADEMVLRVYDASGIVRDVAARRAARAATNPTARALPGDVEEAAIEQEVAEALDRTILVPGVWGQRRATDPQFYFYWHGRLAVFNAPAIQARIGEALATWPAAAEHLRNHEN